MHVHLCGTHCASMQIKISKCHLCNLHVDACVSVAGVDPGSTGKAGKRFQGCEVHKRGGT